MAVLPAPAAKPSVAVNIGNCMPVSPAPAPAPPAAAEVIEAMVRASVDEAAATVPAAAAAVAPAACR